MCPFISLAIFISLKILVTYFLNFCFPYGFIFTINLDWRRGSGLLSWKLIILQLISTFLYNSILKIYLFIIICVRIDIAYGTQVLVESWKGTRCPGAGVTSSCEPPDTCCEANLGPVQEQRVLLTLQPPA